ncbi:MAG: hypothetical protein H6626_07510 [Pseudobdellovibrionaceae bacterium]|nr:hypothetical protein [Bdellovibrionales bacterium]USN46075.1 MAG: hypothetical protein H6626_07510 [Pseudobdellovibrionaceae bacterium]
MSHKNPIVLKIIWMSFFLTLFMYAYVVEMQVGPMPASFEIDLSNPVAMALSVVSLVILMMSFVMPAILSRAAQTPSKEQTPVPPSESAPKGNSNVPLIIRWAFLESIAINGMVASFSSQQNMILPFLAVSAVGFLLSFPKGQ